MTPLNATAEPAEAPLFSDGVGDRVVAVDAATGDLLQILRVRPKLLAVASFEFALRERAARLANFRHAYYARVRRIDRHPTGIAIVSDHVEGVRLSDMLRVAQSRGLQLDLNAALCLLRQLVPSVALLHENARDVAHGLLAPERLIVTPRARLVIVEHVLGSAVEQLQFTRERLWQELRVAVPASAGIARFDHRADVTAMGVIALSLVLGRPVAENEYPARAAQLLNAARARSAGFDDQPLPDALHNWIARALHLDPRLGFASATEAQAALEDALADDSGFVAAPVALETFLSRYIAVMLESPVTPAPAPAPAVARAPETPAASVTRPIPPAPPPNVIREFMDAPVPKPAPPVARPPVTPPASVIVREFTESLPAAPSAAKVSVEGRPMFAPVLPKTTVDTPKPPVEAGAPAPGTPAEPATVADPFVWKPSTPPVATSPRTSVEPPAFVSSAQPRVEPRDITELLRDFDLPALPAAPEPRTEPLAQMDEIEEEQPRKRFQGWRRWAVAALALVAVAEGVIIAARAYNAPVVPTMGSLSVQTNPPGVEVLVDGVSRGNTPARISLPAGSHILELRGRGVPRVIPVTVTAGAEASQYLELPETPSSGSLLVQSDPAGAKVTVDGVDHGVAPVSVADLAPGEHEVVLQAEGGVPVKQRVVIQAGVTSSVLAPVSTAAPGPVSGWIAVKAPVSVEIFEGGRLIGTTESDKIMLAAGRHDIEVVNETLGYRATRSIQVPPGKVSAINVELPQGVINVNASPWAEIWIDGRRVGETPIGNFPIAIGPHEVVFRHPQFGEKRQAVSVTLKAPVRMSVDMK
jgi:hypothetical protein